MPDLVSRTGKLSWAKTRPILEQLTDELIQAEADGTLPAALAVAQVWVQADGRPQLLDWPLTAEPGARLQVDVKAQIPESSACSPEQRSMDLIRQSAVLALESAPRPEGGLAAPIHAVVPKHAFEMLNRLLGATAPYESVKQFREALAETVDRATHTTRPRRAAHLAVLAAFLISPLGGCIGGAAGTLGPGSLTDLIDRIWNEEKALAALREGSVHSAVISITNPNPFLRLWAVSWLDDEPQLRDRLIRALDRDRTEWQARMQSTSWYVRPCLEYFEQAHRWMLQISDDSAASQHAGFMKTAQFYSERQVVDLDTVHFILAQSFWLIIWVLWAFVARDGFTFRMMGLSLVQSDGRRASRTRCAWRAFLTWAPVIVLVAASLWIVAWCWSTWEPSRSSNLALWWSWGLWWVGLLLLPAYVVLALRFPERSLHDRLAGTYLVPR